MKPSQGSSDTRTPRRLLPIRARPEGHTGRRPVWPVAVVLAVLLLALAGTGLLATRTPSSALPQAPARAYQVGFLSGGMPQSWHDDFEAEVAAFGSAGGQNVFVERRYSMGNPDRLPALAAELVDLGVDVIVANDTPSIVAAKNATGAIPIVMATAGDPVGQGFIASLARPGGNITGLTSIAPDMALKRLEVLKELIPSLTSVAVVWDPRNPARQQEWDYTLTAAAALPVRVVPMHVRGREDLEPVFAGAADMGAGAVMVFADQVISTNRDTFLGLAASHRMPVMFEGSQWVERGGLISYGPNIRHRLLRSAAYVDKILRGANPAELPVEAPTVFEVAVNLKTAESLGLIIPKSVLDLASQFVE